MNYKKEAEIRAEFTMGELDFRRFDESMRSINALKIRVGSGYREYYPALREAVEVLFAEWTPILQLHSKDIVKKLKQKFEQLDKYEKNDLTIRMNRTRPYTFGPSAGIGENEIIEDLFGRAFKLLKEIHMELLSHRQHVGFGIPTTRKATDSETLKRGLDLDD